MSRSRLGLRARHVTAVLAVAVAGVGAGLGAVAAAGSAGAATAAEFTGAAGTAGTTGAEAVIAFTSIERTPHSGIAKPTFAVVRDDAAWADLWRRHAAPRRPAPVRPDVDFAREQVVAVFLGQRPNGCHAVEVRQVRQAATGRTVVYRETRPGPDDLCTAQIVTPAHLVRVPASPLAAAFRAE
jgi:hypothetical protein